MEQMYGVGDVAMLYNPYGNPFRVKIQACIYDDEEGTWYYEVTPTDWEVIGDVNREVPQKALKRI